MRVRSNEPVLTTRNETVFDYTAAAAAASYFVCLLLMLQVDSEWSRLNGSVVVEGSAANTSPRSSLGIPPVDEISRQQSPQDRDVAAARLRSILTSAMDASRITAAASESGPTRSNVRLPSAVFPPERQHPVPGSRSMPLPWNKLPEVSTASLSLSATGLPSYQNAFPTADAFKSPLSSEPRLLGRLAPLVAPQRPQISYSPRLEPIHSIMPGQSNVMLSTFTGGPRKSSSMYGNAK